MQFFLVGVSLLLVPFLISAAKRSAQSEFDQELLPLFVKQLAKEAFRNGRTVMTRNDKLQIEAYTQKKWQELDILSLNSIWYLEIKRLQGLK